MLILSLNALDTVHEVIHKYDKVRNQFSSV